jgi:hypothetical protein
MDWRTYTKTNEAMGGILSILYNYRCDTIENIRATTERQNAFIPAQDLAVQPTY